MKDTKNCLELAPDCLKQQLDPYLLNSQSLFFIAYSGGLDSHVLLHAAAKLIPKARLNAIHVNHGLSPNANIWQQHVETICAALSVNLYCEKILEKPVKEEGIEGWARRVRYASFQKYIQPHAFLLTAHTQGDQAETVLLQLLRGAGPAGLAAMLPEQPFAHGKLIRPLLNFSRTQLEQYARGNQLNWIEDESNTNLSFDRNFLRHQIMPILKQRWPGFTKKFARSAENCQEANRLLNDIACQDLDGLNKKPNALSIYALTQLPPERQHNVLRYWLKTLGCLLPNSRHLYRIFADLVHSHQDRNPIFSWGKWSLRRFKDDLLLTERETGGEKNLEPIKWNLQTELVLPHIGKIIAEAKQGGSLTSHLDLNNLSIRFRRGGERCRLPGKTHSSSLKKLFQEWNIPPWQRNQIPLLYQGEDLIGVIGYCICEGYLAQPNEIGWSIAFS